MNEAQSAILSADRRKKVLDRVIATLQKRFYAPEKLNGGWQVAVERHRPLIEAANTPADFEKEVSNLLKELQTSHLGHLRRFVVSPLTMRDPEPASGPRRLGLLLAPVSAACRYRLERPFSEPARIGFPQLRVKGPWDSVTPALRGSDPKLLGLGWDCDFTVLDDAEAVGEIVGLFAGQRDSQAAGIVLELQGSFGTK